MNALHFGTASLKDLQPDAVLVERYPAKGQPKRAYRITGDIAMEPMKNTPGETSEPRIRVRFPLLEYREQMGDAFFQELGLPPRSKGFVFTGDKQVNPNFKVRKIGKLEGNRIWLEG